MKRLRTGRAGLALCLLGAGAGACESPSAPPEPAAVVVAAGDGQSAVAGATLAVPPAVRVEDARGKPVADVPVQFAVAEGGGSVAAGTVRTDRSGAASAGSWALGPGVGTNVLTAKVEGLPAIRFTATSTPGAPAVLRVHAGDAQSARVGQRVAVPPTVQVLDAHENPVPGAPVTFHVINGEGALVAPSANGPASASSVTLTTGADGLAAPTSWQLGTAAGANELEARVAGLADIARFTASGEPGPAAGLVPLSAVTQAATVGTNAPAPPRVRVTDAYGNGVAGIEVRFAVAGGGTVTGPGGTGAAVATSTSNAAGVAAVAAWVLGTATGPNTVEARAGGVDSALTFDALATPGPAATAVIQAGDGQTAPAGSAVPTVPAVLVSDEFGNPVPGTVVTFEITAGGGALSGSIRTTDNRGVAGVAAWKLGPLPGPNSIAADVAGMTTLHFTATGTPPGGGGGGPGGGTTGFTLDVRYTEPMGGSQLAAFNAAADRWAAAITGDLPDVFVTVSAGGCGAPHPAVSETIDDVVIFVTVKPIDGPGKVLGSAGPCRIRPSGLTALGIVYLDSDDLAGLEANGLLADVIIHEMGHVLGIGTLWPPALLIGAGGADPVFAGAAAVANFLAAGGSVYPGTPVPVENTGGPGTKDAHWRESVLASEIMTGWINFGGNPLSSITVGSLKDMGYAVDTGSADAFALTAAASLDLSGSPAVEIIEGTLPPPIIVNATASAPLPLSPVSGIAARHLASRKTAS